RAFAAASRSERRSPSVTSRMSSGSTGSGSGPLIGPGYATMRRMTSRIHASVLGLSLLAACVGSKDQEVLDGTSSSSSSGASSGSSGQGSSSGTSGSSGQSSGNTSSGSSGQTTDGA